MTLRILLALIVIVSIATVSKSWQVQPACGTETDKATRGLKGYYRQPTINGDLVVFVCEDDLWSVSLKGGIARRLTAGRGSCRLPRLSPDGGKIAFVGTEEGHPEIYVMPSIGGVAKRLTYLGSNSCILSGWSADGREILFSSDSGMPFARQRQAFAVNASGGMPRPLKSGHVATMARNASGAMLIGRNNLDPARWKRYRGGMAGELWVDTAGSGEFKPLIELKGNLVWPMWIGKRAYFLSDHEGIGNIYSCLADGSDLRRHTNQDTYFVRFPSTDGKRIVYTAGARLFVYDTSANNERQLSVQAPSSSTQLERRFVKTSKYLEDFTLHPKGHTLALVARGQPYTMPLWEGAVVQHGVGSKVRYSLPGWLPDGKRFVVLMDKEGYQRVELHQADQSRPPELITDEDMGIIRDLAVAPQAELVAMTNHKNELLLLDLKSKELKVVDRSRADNISDLSWSPDGRWLAYSWSPLSDQSIIRIVDTANGAVHDVTNPIRRDFSPCFDPEGKYLYFLSSRDFLPVYDATQFNLSFPSAVRPYLVTLRKNTASPFVPEIRPIVKDSKEDEKGKGKDDGPQSPGKHSNARSGGKKKTDPVVIDFDGIKGRLLAFPVDEGRYRQLAAAKGRLLFTKFPVKGIQPNRRWYKRRGSKGVLKAYVFEEQKVSTVQAGVDIISMAGDNRTVVYKSKSRLRVIDALDKKGDKRKEKKSDEEPGRKSGWLDLSRVKVLVEPAQEWSQMLQEAWRLQRQHFWDEQMSQVDWKLVLERYRALLPRVRTRSDLSDLIWEMQGELGTSHAYEFLGDYRPTPNYRRGFLGADLSFDKDTGGYRIDRIYRGDSWNRRVDSPLAEPGLRVNEGDAILAVGGRTVSREVSVDELLIHSAGETVMLTVLPGKKSRDEEAASSTKKNPKSEDGDSSGKRRIVVRTLKDEHPLRYRSWVEANRRYVHERSRGKVGYVHIPDMGPRGFAEFHRGFLAEYNHPALIVDVRYNGGGHVSSLLLEKLRRKRVGYDVSRWGQPEPYPHESVAGPIVAVTNQFAGSDGDIFSHCFKLYDLGPLVGKRTWGGVIGISTRYRLVDGTITTQPEYSFWFKDVGWGVENFGTEPTHEVDIAPQDYREGRDPQLDKALELAMKRLEREPVRLPEFGKHPSLALPTMRK